MLLLSPKKTGISALFPFLYYVKSKIYRHKRSTVNLADKEKINVAILHLLNCGFDRLMGVYVILIF